MQATDPHARAIERRRLDAGRLLVALGALILIISLFLDWYGEPGSDEAITAWRAFELIDLLLLVLGLAVLITAAEAILALGRTPQVPPSVLALVGPVALLLILISIIDDPPLVAGFDPTLEAGIWIALAAAVLMTVGTLLSAVRISIVVGARERAAAADPGAETRPLYTEPDEPGTSPGPSTGRRR